jgi:ferredoxin-NADP reductase
MPWVFPSVFGLLLGGLVHAVWFAACELLAPPSLRASAVAVRSSAPSAPVRPARAPVAPPPARAPAARPPDTRSPQGFVTVPVLATLNETSTIKTFRVGRPEGFEFEAGQFLTVRVRVDGKEYARCYSISSPPQVRGYLEISVKRHGVVSNALHATARPGSMLAVRRPVGAFKYPAGDDRPIVLIAGGIGITPLVSMLRHGVAAEPARPITLLYSAHSEDEFAFRDELTVLARRHPQLRVQFAAAAGAARPDVYPGRIDGTLLRTVPDLAHSISFLCGPAPMVDAMKAALQHAGVPASQVRHEVFQAAIAAASASAERPAPAAPVRPATRQMNCARTRKRVPIGLDQTLLEAAEEGGVEISSLCRSGVCGTCRIQVQDGDVDCQSSALDDDDRSQGFVLACVSTARTDCTVDL